MHGPLCLCSALPALETETQVTLFSHVTEIDKPTNTARLLDLCLPNAIVHPVEGPRALRPTLELPPWRRAYVLYPSPEAPVLDQALAHADPRPITLLVPDGTWSQTRRIVRRVLGEVPRLRLPDGPASRFRLRTGAAHLDRIYTLEAVARALGIIEGHAVEAALLDVLDRMVERTLFTRGMLDADAVSGGIDRRAHANAMSASPDVSGQLARVGELVRHRGGRRDGG